MTTEENKNFISVKEFYMPLSIKDIENQLPTEHLSEKRQNRINFAFKLNRVYTKEGEVHQSEVDRVFLVDKGHIAGKEIHIVTKKGIIFILNESKFLYGKHSFITVLLGRPNQVKRLYEACNLVVPENILNYCKKYQENGLNETINN